MEIIGRNIPQLQSAISSGLDNVTAGIAESVKISGVSAIDDTFEIFSTSNMGITADANLLPAVANVAEYLDPISGLATQSNSSSEAASSLRPLLQTMQDPKFRPEDELAKFTEGNVNEAFKNLGKELLYQTESESGQGRNILKNDSLISPPFMGYSGKPSGEGYGGNPFGDFLEKKQKEIENKIKEMEAREAEKWRQIKDSLGQVDQLPYVSAADGDLGLIPQGNTNGAGSGSPQVESGSLAAADTGTASSNTLEARGIIIVGGKSDGTYFQTIDDTINELQNDPQPETVNLLQNQVTAVQDMTTTSMQAVQLNQQFSASLKTAFRG